ncbi:hypothetical protein V5306_26955, partial [Escherichia coli]|uniref:hypothetical protein n=1 Tax=Escherichia coli TaxID=562 RepID=UPI002FD49156
LLATYQNRHPWQPPQGRTGKKHPAPLAPPLLLNAVFYKNSHYQPNKAVWAGFFRSAGNAFFNMAKTARETNF